MMPGPDQIVACPRCGALAKYTTFLSGNTIGALLWTDDSLRAVVALIFQEPKC